MMHQIVKTGESVHFWYVHQRLCTLHENDDAMGPNFLLFLFQSFFFHGMKPNRSSRYKETRW